MPKGIFIGIGGTGVTTVAKLKALLFQRAYSSDKRALDEDCSFIFYDTDEMSIRNALSDAELQRMMGGYPVIDLGTEFIDAGPTAPYIMYQAAKNAPMSYGICQRMLEWAIDPDVPGHYQLPQKQLSEGAGAQRMAGRCGFMFKREEFEEMIRTGIRKLGQLDEQGANLRAEHPAIWVFSSSNGGTSSSALLDVLYLVNRLYKNHVADVSPYLRLVLYLPKAFIDMNKMNALNYSRNAYATLWELNEFRNDAVLNNDGKKFGTFAAQPDRPEWATIQTPWEVCSYVMAVDVESQKGRVTLDQMYANTAELCYYMHTGAAGMSMISNLDNDFVPGGPFYGQYTTSKTDGFKWSKFLVGSGFKAIVKSDDFLKDYVRKRFRYDMFGYGLMGLSFEKILPAPEQRKEAAKAFADKYILRHLLNLNNFDQSPRDSLYGIYQNAFDTVMIPHEDDVPSRDEWNNMGKQFVFECKAKIHSISNDFNSPTCSSESKEEWIKKIENSVKQGVDESIVDYGLNYTYALLAWVDDEYCEMEVMNSLKLRNNLYSLEKDIENIIAGNRPRRGIGELVAIMGKYKQACIYELAIEHIRTIIQEITKERVGFLEYLRKGDQNHKGIAGLIQTFNGSFTASKEDYLRLASTFKKTANDVCSDYFPLVSEFVQEGDAWSKGHLFEELYSSIVPLNMEENAEVFENCGDFGCPPLRDLGDNGLSAIISLIKNRVSDHDYLFADMALSNPLTEFDGMNENLLREIDRFIEDAMEDNRYGVKDWLDMPLQTVFNEYFSKDGVVDTAAQSNYVCRFTNSVPVFYPIASDVMPSTQDRWLYVGANSVFATIMGYQVGNYNHQYIPDPNMGNRFLVCKIEVGHSFYEYKYFDLLNDLYERDIKTIQQEGSGCHIHKDFINRDIAAAFEKRKGKRFDDFIALCWYDSFFEYLDSMQDKTYINAFFGEKAEIPALNIPPKDLPKSPMGMPSLPDFIRQSTPTFGYTPIVSLSSFGTLTLNIRRIRIIDGLIGFVEPDYQLTFNPQSLYMAYSSIIKDDHVDYYQDYLSIIDEQYQKLSITLKAGMQKMIIQTSMFDDDIVTFTSEVGKRFKEKLRPMFATFKNNRADELVWYRIWHTIFRLIGKYNLLNEHTEND